MNILFCKDREAFRAALDQVSPGDCIRTDSLMSLAETSEELISALARLHERSGELISEKERIDTRGEQGPAFFALCGVLRELNGSGKQIRRRDGIEKARAEGRYRGRKPITVDEEQFNAVVARWKNGDISARQAMAELELKPNTFYRRIKEQEEQNMNDSKKAQHEFRAEIKAASKKSRQELDDLKKQVHAEAREIKKEAAEKLELRDVEREIRKGRAQAEAEHQDTVKQMKKDVEAEAKEWKKRLEETEESTTAAEKDE